MEKRAGSIPVPGTIFCAIYSFLAQENSYVPPSAKPQTGNKKLSISRIFKGLKAILGFPFYTYRIYSRLVSLEAKLENYLNEVNCDVKSIQYHAGIKTSVTDSIPYEQTLKSILNNDHLFDTFRIEPIVKSTYEHEFLIGQKKSFFDLFRSNQKILENLNELLKNDMVGLGLTEKVPLNTKKNIQHCINTTAGTTLRYIAIAHLIEQYFGTLEGFRIVEIGVGYGGQGRILDVLHRIQSYRFVDLPLVLALTQKYFSHFKLNMQIDCKTMEQLADAGKYDLLISNYAFSELSRPIQQIYIDKILRKSKRGFILVNNTAEQFLIDQFSYTELCRRFRHLAKCWPIRFRPAGIQTA